MKKSSIHEGFDKLQLKWWRISQEGKSSCSNMTYKCMKCFYKSTWKKESNVPLFLFIFLEYQTIQLHKAHSFEFPLTWGYWWQIFFDFTRQYLFWTRFLEKYLTGYRLLDWLLFSVSMLKTFQCLLTSILAIGRLSESVILRI